VGHFSRRIQVQISIRRMKLSRAARHNGEGDAGESCHRTVLQHHADSEYAHAFWLGALRPYDELDLAIENLKQSKQLVDGLPIVRLIKKSVELGWGRSEPPNDFAPA
jgi:hypothetical protein